MNREINTKNIIVLTFQTTTLQSRCWITHLTLGLIITGIRKRLIRESQVYLHVSVMTSIPNCQMNFTEPYTQILILKKVLQFAMNG